MRISISCGPSISDPFRLEYVLVAVETHNGKRYGRGIKLGDELNTSSVEKAYGYLYDMLSPESIDRVYANS